MIINGARYEKVCDLLQPKHGPPPRKRIRLRWKKQGKTQWSSWHKQWGLHIVLTAHEWRLHIAYKGVSSILNAKLTAKTVLSRKAEARRILEHILNGEEIES